jgi:N-methylhydantoinase B
MLLCYPDGKAIDVPAHANIDRGPPGTVQKKWNTGGGYGPPRRRALEKVERDLREGYITAAEARHIYGHAVAEEGEPPRSARQEDQKFEDGQ